MSRFAEILRAPVRSLLPAVGRDRSGVAALEYALALPVLLMVVLGIIEVGRALAVRNEMSHALGRTTRIVHLTPSTTPEQIAASLEGYLENYDTELEVSITEISGTSFMEISVQFPFEISIPFAPISEVTLSVATLAPMVSPTQ